MESVVRNKQKKRVNIYDVEATNAEIKKETFSDMYFMNEISLCIDVYNKRMA